MKQSISLSCEAVEMEKKKKKKRSNGRSRPERGGGDDGTTESRGGRRKGGENCEVQLLLFLVGVLVSIGASDSWELS